MIKCSVCGREFKNKSGLAGHVRFEHPRVDSEAIVSMFKTVSSIIKTHGDEIGELHRWQISQADELKQLLDMFCKADLQSIERDSQIHGTIADIQECLIDFTKMLTPWVKLISERTKTAIPVVKVKHAKE